MAEPELIATRSRVADSLEAVNNLYYARGWSDGLPIVPPTEARVMAMLGYTDRDAQEVVAEIPPKGGQATIEKLAINAVMAGCLPQYLPVVITAIQAMTEAPFKIGRAHV